VCERERVKENVCVREREGERGRKSSAFFDGLLRAYRKGNLNFFLLLFHFWILDDVEVIGICEGKLDANQCGIFFNLRPLPHTK
jgi:hypothetical protein